MGKQEKSKQRIHSFHEEQFLAKLISEPSFIISLEVNAILLLKFSFSEINPCSVKRFHDSFFMVR